MFKTCNKCKESKEETQFYANKRMKDGLNTFCIACHKHDNLARKAKNRANPEYLQAESLYRKRYYLKNKDLLLKNLKLWRQNNKSYLQIYNKHYRQTNMTRLAFLCQKRKLDIQNRIPSWTTTDDLWLLSEAYSLAAFRSKIFGFQWDVDHIIPLRGKIVSGLHTIENIQVIPAITNRKKSNSFEV